MKPQFEQGLLHPNGLGRTSAPQRRQVGRGLAEAIGAGEEGIGAALASDGGFRSMPAVHDGRIRQRKQLALDAFQQGVEVGPREVGPPDRSLKQDVAAERHALALEHHTAGGVPGSVTDADRESPHPQLVAVRELAVGRGQPFGAHAEGQGLLGDVIVQHAVRRMQADRGSSIGLEPWDAEDVVDVRVGEPNPDRPDALGLQLVSDQTGLLARVDNGTLARGFVDQEVAVLDELAVRDRYDLHSLTAWRAMRTNCGSSRTAARYFSTAIAAVVASPTAVVIWRVSWLRTSPAAKRPGMEVIIRSSVTKYPPASCLKWPSTSPALGLNPMKMNTPPTRRFERPPVAASTSSR